MTMRRLLLVIAVLTACKGPSRARPAPDAAPLSASSTHVERWGGRVLLPPDTPLTFELDLDCSDPPHATIAIPAQKLAPTDLVGVTCAGRVVTFTLALPGVAEDAQARFEIARRDDGTAAGKLHQNRMDFDVELGRLADGETVAAGPTRPQTPEPPFPYDDREARYASKDGTGLAGTLSVPHGGGRFAAVLMISGTGTQDRDETLFGHQPFRVIADHLARAGIAVLRVDDRGAGSSGGSTDGTALPQKVEDVLAGVAWLAAQPDIDPARIGLIGHSEGGELAPMAAAASPAIAFLVLLAAPGVSGAEIATRQMTVQLEAMGVAPKIVAARVEGQQALIALALGGADDAAMRAAIGAHLDAMASMAGAHLDAAQRAARVEEMLGPLTAVAARSFLATDPRPALRRVRVPVLALWGSLDVQVDPEINLAAVRGALGSDDVTTAVLPGLNHLFQPATRGTLDEYAAIETTIAPAALDAITTWLVRWKEGVP